MSAKLDIAVGQAIFEKVWVSSPSSTQASDGLGPFYNARSCSQCHRNNTVVAHLNDSIYGKQLQTFGVPGLAAEGALYTRYEYLSKPLSGGENIVLRRPSHELQSLRYGPLSNAQLSLRRAGSLSAVSVIEMIPEEVILALEDEFDDDGDGISGRANIVWDSAQRGGFVGRFGWKAEQINLAQQTALAFVMDMGISNPLYPDAYGDCTEVQFDCFELPNGNSLQHDGLEASDKMFQSLMLYMNSFPVVSDAVKKSFAATQGEKLFDELECSTCHIPEMGSIGAMKVLRPYSDLLLHDMGKGLSDELIAEDAADIQKRALASEWRTAPLQGLSSAMGAYLHDGRARTLTEAILWHGGEARVSVSQFSAMSYEKRRNLIAFLNTL